MKVAAAEFKAKCLAYLDQVHQDGRPIIITKRGRVIARLVRAEDEEHRPWLRIRGRAKWKGDPCAPAVDETDLDAL
ncbi:MAG TPA: type II toxin-antitoxin system Phd/YefM family antitoxin [Vicinamibacterales bacterium]|jgi:prevent-host-death family protein|nr:type II toxin-antitoxin system Phd/YefM family antitoxin [Vicinamibacterales bacterium]